MTSNADDDFIAALRDVIDSMYGEYDGGTRGALRPALGSSMTQASGISLPELTAAVQASSLMKTAKEPSRSPKRFAMVPVILQIGERGNDPAS